MYLKEKVLSQICQDCKFTQLKTERKVMPTKLLLAFGRTLVMLKIYSENFQAGHNQTFCDAQVMFQLAFAFKNGDYTFSTSCLSFPIYNFHFSPYKQIINISYSQFSPSYIPECPSSIHYIYHHLSYILVDNTNLLILFPLHAFPVFFPNLKEITYRLFVSVDKIHTDIQKEC